MDWIALVTGIIGALAASGGSMLYFRPKLKEARANADKTQVEYLTQRLDSMGKLYEAQGKILDEIRARMLQMGKEMQAKDERIAQLEAENRLLANKVAKLEKAQAKNKANK